MDRTALRAGVLAASAATLALFAGVPVAAARAQQPASATLCRVQRVGGEPAAGEADLLSPPPAYDSYGDERLAALIEEGLARQPAGSGGLVGMADVAPSRGSGDGPSRSDAHALTQHVQPPETRVGPQIAMLSVRPAASGLREARSAGPGGGFGSGRAGRTASRPSAPTWFARSRVPGTTWRLSTGRWRSTERARSCWSATRP